MAENDLLASLTGDHELDVAARVHDETSGLQEDHHSGCFLERSAGPDHGNFAVAGLVASGRVGGHSRPNDGEPVVGDTELLDQLTAPGRDWSPRAGGTSGGSAASRAPTVPKRETVWTYGSRRCLRQGQGNIAHLVVDDVEQVGTLQPAMRPEPADREGSQPAVSERGQLDGPRVVEQVVPLGKAKNLDVAAAPLPADRARGSRASRHRRQLSRPARIKTLSPPPAMSSEPRRRECGPP